MGVSRCCLAPGVVGRLGLERQVQRIISKQTPHLRMGRFAFKRDLVAVVIG